MLQAKRVDSRIESMLPNAPSASRHTSHVSDSVRHFTPHTASSSVPAPAPVPPTQPVPMTHLP